MYDKFLWTKIKPNMKSNKNKNYKHCINNKNINNNNKYYNNNYYNKTIKFDAKSTLAIVDCEISLPN